MKILYFDCFSGISGDMAVGAMLDLGISPLVFKRELARLKIKGLSVVIKKTKKNSIAGTDFSVKTGEKHVHGRHLQEIIKIINSSRIAPAAKELSIRVFNEIGRAEAKVHGTSVDKIHFHEVGALDSIADIVGAAICVNLLGAEKIYSSELHDGRGTIECAHGTIPVPVPAVVEMMAGSGIPMVQENIWTELITPTGMGIIKCAASGFGAMPAMKIIKTGYGFGKRDTGGVNALRVVMGDGSLAGNAEKIIKLETNIDNMTPEMLGFAMEMLFEAGAVDVFFTPIYMKKNRPAVMLTALSSLENENAVMEAMFKHTSTLGMRREVLERYCMDREMKTVRTKYGPIRVKCALLRGIVKQSPEYEDCRKIALKTGMPLRDVYDMAMKSLPSTLKNRG